MGKVLSGWRLTLVDQESKAAYYLHALRWFSAFYVMIYHLRPVLFKGYDQLEQKSAAIKALYAATSIGNEFVMLFFVLSGYLIGGSVFKSVKNGNWSWKQYLLNRMTRLWTVLFSALILTYILARVQLLLFPQFGGGFENSLNWKDFIGNLFFLQGVFFPNYGENLPLWSLSYEFWYYILFPCLVQFLAAKHVGKRIAYAIAFLIVSLVLGKSIMLYFVIWLLGAALVILPAPRLPKILLARFFVPVSIAASTVLLVLTKYVLELRGSSEFLAFASSLAVSFGFTVMIYGILHTFDQKATAAEIKRGLHIHVVLAGFSYTLYLTHYPVINFIRVWLGDGKWGTWNPDLPHLLLALGIAVAICLYAWVLSLVTEAKTAEVRAFFQKLLEAPAQGKNAGLDTKSHHI